MNSLVKQEPGRFFPTYISDPGHRKYDEYLARSGLPADWMEICRMLDAAETEEEKELVSKKIPMKPLHAVLLKREMGKEAFLAEGFNLDYANELLGGSDWVDRL